VVTVRSDTGDQVGGVVEVLNAKFVVPRRIPT
jgi:hypothetical protein